MIIIIMVRVMRVVVVVVMMMSFMCNASNSLRGVLCLSHPQVNVGSRSNGIYSIANITDIHEDMHLGGTGHLD